MLAPQTSSFSSVRTASTRANLRASTADGAAFGVMVGVGETYFAAFALAIGLGEVAAGLISSLPMLAGGLLQLISLRAVQWLGSEKRWVLACATVQGLAFLPLAVAGLLGSISLGAMLVIASAYWAAGLASGPAWNTWMQSIVPSRVRAKYFARRTRASQFTTLAAFLSGGLLLQWSRGAGLELAAFATLFAVAAAFRLVSVVCLSRHHSLLGLGDRSPGPASGAVAHQRTASSVSISSTGIRLLAFLVVMQGMVQISGPFFAPFLLEQLDYSYAEFAALIGVAFAAKGIAFAAWASVARKRGASWLMWVGGVGIAPIALLWVVSQNFVWLLVVQVLSGSLWAAYELGFFLMFFETLPVHKRTKMLTIYNFANTCAWCVGSMAGAAILSALGTSHSGYLALFALSSVGRLLAIGLLAKTLPPKVQLVVQVRNIGVRVLGLRPSSGGMDLPILPSIPSPSDSRRAA